MKTLYKIEELPGRRKCAVFRVSTDRGDQFLCTESESDMMSVVEVDSAYFLELWRNDNDEAHRHVSQGSPETWVNDRKFHYAEDGFSCGESNPVPLAYVTCEVRNEVNHVWQRRFLFFREYMGQQVTKRIPYVGFIDGITRTIWLLTYGVKCFPVMCRTSDADLLQLMAGFPECKSLTLKELLAQNQNSINC